MEDGEEVKIAVVWEFDYASGMRTAAYAVRPEEKKGRWLDVYAKTRVQ